MFVDISSDAWATKALVGAIMINYSQICLLWGELYKAGPWIMKAKQITTCFTNPANACDERHLSNSFTLWLREMSSYI